MGQTPFVSGTIKYRRGKYMTKYFRKKSMLIAFLLPAIFVYTFSVFIPVLVSLFYSLNEWDGITGMQFVGLKNYTYMLFNDKRFYNDFFNNLYYVIINLILQMGIATSFAVLLTKIKRGRNLFQTIYFVPMILSKVSVCQVFKRIYSLEPMGPINYILGVLGLEKLQTSFLTDAKMAMNSVIFVDTYKNMGLYMIIIFTALLTIPDVEEAARLDGARSFTMLFRIKLPLIKNVLFSCAILIISGTLKAFDIPYVLTGGGPGIKTELLAGYMYSQGFAYMKYGYASTITVFIAVECLVINGFVKLFQTRLNKD